MSSLWAKNKFRIGLIMPNPKIELNYDKLDALLQFKVSLDFCADYLGCSEDTIRRRLKEDHGMTFTQYHALKMQRTAFKLQQRAIQLALEGKSHAVMIFALKNLANWTDKEQHDIVIDNFNFVGDSD